MLVTYGKGAELINQLKYAGASRDLMRKLQRYTVTVRKLARDHLLKMGDIRELPNLSGVYEQITPGLYDPKLGLLVNAPQLASEDLMW